MTGVMGRESTIIDAGLLCYHLIRNFTGLPVGSVEYETE